MNALFRLNDLEEEESVDREDIEMVDSEADELGEMLRRFSLEDSGSDNRFYKKKAKGGKDGKGGNGLGGD